MRTGCRRASIAMHRAITLKKLPDTTSGSEREERGGGAVCVVCVLSDTHVIHTYKIYKISSKLQAPRSKLQAWTPHFAQIRAEPHILSHQGVSESVNNINKESVAYNKFTDLLIVLSLAASAPAASLQALSVLPAPHRRRTHQRRSRATPNSALGGPAERDPPSQPRAAPTAMPASRPRSRHWRRPCARSQWLRAQLRGFLRQRRGRMIRAAPPRRRSRSRHARAVSALPHWRESWLHRARLPPRTGPKRPSLARSPVPPKLRAGRVRHPCRPYRAAISSQLRHPAPRQYFSARASCPSPQLSSVSCCSSDLYCAHPSS